MTFHTALRMNLIVLSIVWLCSPAPGDWRPISASEGAGLGHTAHLGGCWQLRVSSRQGMLQLLMSLPVLPP